MSNDHTPDEYRNLLASMSRQIEKKLLDDVFTTKATSNIPDTPPPQLNVDMLAEMRKQLRTAPPIPRDILLLGRAEDTAVIRRLFESAAGDWRPAITEGRSNAGPDKMVLMVIGDLRPRFALDRNPVAPPTQYIKVYLESAEETFRKWTESGENLAQLIERLERAQQH